MVQMTMHFFILFLYGREPGSRPRTRIFSRSLETRTETCQSRYYKTISRELETPATGRDEPAVFP
jgi:hypothetical protein